MNTDMTLQYRDILFQQFEKKKIRNARYSLRAFARDLDVPVSRLSDVFSGKKNPSLPMANHLAEKLGLSLLQKELFVASVEVAKEKTIDGRVSAEKKLETIYKKVRNQWTLETFEQISQWLDLSICVALSLENPPTTVEAIAKLFGISVIDADNSVKKLISTGEIYKTETGWACVEENTQTPPETTSAAIRRFHCQMLTKAKISLLEDPIEDRDFTSLVFSLNSKELPLLKKRIAQIRDQLMMEFGQSKEADAVYDISIALFPISKKQRNAYELF